MSNSLLKNKLRILMEYGLTEHQAAKLIIGGSYYEKNGGVEIASYWCNSSNFDIRDEFYLIANLYFASVSITPRYYMHIIGGGIDMI